MRTLSKKTQYSLRALYTLSRAYGGPPVLIADMAERESIPKRFLEQILLQLKSEGLVDSKKGKGGGYVLSRPPARITVGEVIRMIEGPLAPLPCASVTAYRRCDECVDDRLCGTRLVMREVRDAMAGILDRTTLAEVCSRVDKLCAEAEAGREPTPAELMYYI
jgi:Rrf2 family protein